MHYHASRRIVMVISDRLRDAHIYRYLASARIVHQPANDATAQLEVDRGLAWGNRDKMAWKHVVMRV